MAKNEYRGLFIAFEGLDGSGASIQAALLANYLEKQGYRVQLTREPTTNLIGGMIRANLSGEWSIDQRGLQLMFAADRAQQLEREIIPALEAGKIVIIDRYIMSSIAYGSHNKPELVKWLEAINQPFVTPDLTFVMKVRPSICAMRIDRERFEKLGMFHKVEVMKEIWKVYESLASRYYQVHVIDGEQEEMSIMRAITDIAEQALGVSPHQVERGRHSREETDRSA